MVSIRLDLELMLLAGRQISHNSTRIGGECVRQRGLGRICVDQSNYPDHDSM